jgi:uncharacterized membrane protein YeaQ/YmgE (transglycosylase-associated protein family)
VVLPTSLSTSVRSRVTGVNFYSMVIATISATLLLLVYQGLFLGSRFQR